MDETAEATIAPPVKRKYTKRKRHTAASPKPLKVPEEFAGMTELDCCTGCNAGMCVISGIGVCGHPFKGGQVPHDSATLARFEKAKRVLAHRKIDLTKG